MRIFNREFKYTPMIQVEIFIVKLKKENQYDNLNLR